VPEERRVVTVLFADVTESTELGEALDPEDVRSLLGAYYAVAKDIVGTHGGTLEKFIGDAVMAVFGLPAAHADDPQRSLSAALALRDAVRRDPSLGDRVRLRMGVNTGDVVASLDRTAEDFIVTGDAVTVAARLQQTTRPWGIACGERTVHAAGSAFKFGPMFSVDVKGKRAPVSAALLLGRESAPFVAQTPFVGRESDLAELELVGRRALHEKRPTFVSLVAPAGTGKTRLLEEFIARLPSIAPRAVVATGQCLPYGQRLTYWPLRAILLRLVGATPDATAAEVRDAVQSWLQGAEVESPDRLAELLAATVGAGESEVTDAAAVQAAWRTAFEIAAKRAPLVVVFEDLHWSSDSLLDLVEFVMRPRVDVPFLMLALTRPELLDRRPHWGGGRRNYLAMSVDPLSDDALRDIVSALAPRISPAISRRIVARAGGNPFYAIELVRALLDRVPKLDDASVVEQSIARLPDNVNAAILERLDQLGPEERRLVQMGSVLGRSFRRPGIAALAPDLTHDYDAILELLLTKDLVRASGPDSFAFRHILIRDVAYQTLPRRERARLHASAATWLESQINGNDEVLAELVAYHYREAASSGQPETEVSGETRRKAVRWLVRAAEVAQAAAANVEAVRHLRAAAELADRTQLADLEERIGDAFASGEAVDSYRRALELARETGRSADQQLRIIAGMLHVTMRSGGMAGGELSSEDIASLRAEGKALLETAADPSSIARFLAADSFHPFWTVHRGQRVPGEPELDEAESSATRALALAEERHDPKLISAALDGLGSILSLRGDHRGGRELARRRIAMGDTLDLMERLDAYAVATWLSVWLGELDVAIATSAEGLSIVQPGQAPGWTLHLVSWRALALYLRGLWDDALVAGDRARTLWSEAGRLPAEFALHGFFAALAVAHARRDKDRFDRFRESIDAVATESGLSPQRRLDFVSDDPRDPDHYLRYFDQRQPEVLQLALSFASDAARPPDPRIVQRLATNARLRTFPLVQAEIKRASGIAGDQPALAEALALFERCGAIAGAARARCERALRTRDRAELEAGLTALERLGDLEQRDRFESTLARQT
jgi:class 3 adenylate cyclase/tetratricopeptide (TPR) repeat protein